MADPTATVTIRLELGEPAPGAWCDTCLLPSAATWPLYGIYPAGVFALGDLVACPACIDVAATVRQAALRVADQLGGTVIDPQE